MTTSGTERAARLAGLVLELAPTYDGRLPEHFGPDWSVDLDLNRDRPDDPFKPYGATVGHGLEWSRLLLHLEATLGDAAPAGLLDTSRLLFERAVADGWHADGEPGFVYTTDWDGRPVVRERMHWVAAEAIAAAAALHRRTGEERLRAALRRVVGLRREHLLRPPGRVLAPRARRVQPAAGQRLGRASPTSTTRSRRPCSRDCPWRRVSPVRWRCRPDP